MVEGKRRGRYDGEKVLGNVIIQKKSTITQDLSRRCIATRGESVSMYPRRPKAEAFSNAVDVVERLHDPTDPSTERTAPHVQHMFSPMTTLGLRSSKASRKSSVSTTAW